MIPLNFKFFRGSSVKVVVAVLVIIGLVFFLSNKKEAEQPTQLVYAEARYKFAVPGREVEMVAIGERRKSSDCDRDSAIETIKKVCTDNGFCFESTYSCKDDVSNQYKKMLQKQPSSTHYLHVQNDELGLKGVSLMWGLTDEESKTICDEILKRINERKNDKAEVVCI